MRVKRAIIFLVFIMAATILFRPSDSEAASELSKLKQQISALKKEMNDTESTKKQIEQDKQAASHQKNVTTQSINVVMDQIDAVSDQMQGVTEELETTEAKLLEAGQSLEEAQARIDSRDKMLESRVRLMYTNGFVSYMDVLMSASSFTDFLDRFDSLQTILGQDKVILEEHKKDKALIVTKKQEIEQQLGSVKTMYAKVENYHQQLLQKENEKEVMVAAFNAKLVNLNNQSDDLEEISGDQEAMLIQLAKKEADLIKAEQARKNKNKKPNSYYTGGKLGMPIKHYSRISSPFGTRTDPFTGMKKTHNGVDFAAPKGTDIFAAESGTVIVAQQWSGYGNCVIIDHGNGLWTIYGHIRDGGIKVEKGQTVKKGEKIAEVGSTGRSTGNHLHFEVRKNEVPVNPLNYLNKV